MKSVAKVCEQNDLLSRTLLNELGIGVVYRLVMRIQVGVTQIISYARVFGFWSYSSHCRIRHGYIPY